MKLNLYQLFSVITLILCLQAPWGICCDSVKSVDNDFRLIKLHYENLTGEKGLTSFFYDENGVMHKARWELLDGSRSSENYYTYDRKGNLIKKYREFSDDITSTVLYNYNEKGNLISEFFDRSDGVTGNTNYEYDKDERLVKAICNGLNGWFYGTIIYKYDVDGRKSKGLIEKNEKQIGTIVFGYDPNGNLIKEYWEFPDSWSQTFIYEYEKVVLD